MRFYSIFYKSISFCKLMFFSAVFIYLCFPLNALTDNLKSENPRLLVLTDIGWDPDDIQSLRRLLLYSNEFRIKGLIATAVPTGIREDLIYDALDDYELIYENLILHSPGYPTAEKLREVVRGGQTNRGVDNLSPGLSTTGSQHIINMVDASDQILNITIWGGAHDLAQALLDVRSTRTSEELADFISKISVYAIADQDFVFTDDEKGTGEWIRENFPYLRYIESGPPWLAIMSASFRGMYQNESAGGKSPVLPLTLPGVETLNDQNWMESNILTWGPLGAGFPSVNQNPNTPRNTRGIKEGDTPSWFYYLPHGLNNPQHPEWGGWGGRFEHVQGGHYVDTQDDHWSGEMDGSLRRKWTVARWREAYQNDFAGRMRWCKLSYEDANHNPVVIVDNDESKDVIIRKIKQGQSITLDASSSYDPDGDNLSFNWWIYHEASSSSGAIIRNSQSATAKIEISDSSPLGDIHLILEVTDDGNPKLFSFRRVILRIMPDN